MRTLRVWVERGHAVSPRSLRVCASRGSRGGEFVAFSPPTSNPNMSKSPSAATSRAARRVGPASGSGPSAAKGSRASVSRRTCLVPRSESAPLNTSDVASGDGVLDTSTAMPLPRRTDEDLCAFGLPPTADAPGAKAQTSARAANIGALERQAKSLRITKRIFAPKRSRLRAGVAGSAP